MRNANHELWLADTAARIERITGPFTRCDATASEQKDGPCEEPRVSRGLRVYRCSPEAVMLQIRAPEQTRGGPGQKDYLGQVPLDTDQVADLIGYLFEQVSEIDGGKEAFINALSDVLSMSDIDELQSRLP